MSPPDFPFEKIRIRAMGCEDHAFLFSLFAAVHANDAMGHDKVWQSLLPMQFQAQLAQQLATQNKSSLALVCMDQTPIGKCFIEYGQEDIHIIDIALLPDYQRRGIGGHLITRLCEEAAASRRFVSLRVQKTSRALRLYLRLGFEIAKDEGVVYLMQFRPSA